MEPGGGGGGGLSFRIAIERKFNTPNTAMHTLLEEEKKVQLWALFVPYLEPSGKGGSQKSSLPWHVQESKKVPYITKNDSKEPKKVLKWF